MHYTVDKNSSEAAYLQLYLQIREDIRRQVYPFGTRLPSKRTLALETGVSTITVEHTYALLCDEGYAQSRQRSGYFVTFRIEDGFPGRPVFLPRFPMVHPMRSQDFRLPYWPEPCARSSVI